METIISPPVTYRRIYHAAHYGGVRHPVYGTGHDLEQWTYAHPLLDPGKRPATIPGDAEFHSGYRDQNSVQHWVYTRRAPLSPGFCEHCVPGGKSA